MISEEKNDSALKLLRSYMNFLATKKGRIKYNEKYNIQCIYCKSYNVYELYFKNKHIKCDDCKLSFIKSNK